jgi:nucleoside-diphosphate-sugar epimerase
MKFATGLSGFIGSHLIKRIPDLVHVPHKDIFKTDWSQATEVYFLSSYGNMAYHNDPEMTVRANVMDLCFVLAQIDWSKLEKFVFVSTSSVKRRVQTMYSRTKKAAEEILLAYIENLNAPITIIRPLSVTGVGEQEEHLIPKLISSCIYGTPMDLVEEPTHDWIDVQDFIDGLIALSDGRHKGIYELGTGIATTNKEVKDLVEKITKKRANVKIVKSMRDYDSESWVSENFNARSTGWLPKKTLKLIITEMYDARRSKTN